MVEQKLKKKEQFRTKHESFRSLNGKVMYPTITAILDYLEESYKIAIEKMVQLLGYLEILLTVNMDQKCQNLWKSKPESVKDFDSW